MFAACKIAGCPSLSPAFGEGWEQASDWMPQAQPSCAALDSVPSLVARDDNSGSLAEFVGKRAVEKAAPWKSPRAGLSSSAWKSRESGGISTFPTAPATTG